VAGIGGLNDRVGLRIHSGVSTVTPIPTVATDCVRAWCSVSTILAGFTVFTVHAPRRLVDGLSVVIDDSEFVEPVRHAPVSYLRIAAGPTVAPMERLIGKGSCPISPVPSVAGNDGRRSVDPIAVGHESAANED
jgi:hypothetical protein